MAKDFYLEAAQEQFNELAADRADIDAGLLRCNANGDSHSAKELIQTRATINRQMRDLQAEYDAHVASQQPQQGPPMNDQEFMARSPERMTGEDVDRIFSKSRYYSKDQWSDPEVARRVQAGMREVEARRKASR